jgi:hypothetical protein
MENGLDFLNPHEFIPDPFDSFENTLNMKELYELKIGNKVMFSIKDMLGEFEDDEENGVDAISHDKQKAVIIGQVMSNCEEGEIDKDYEYYDIEFQDKTVLYGISGYHLTLI